MIAITNYATESFAHGLAQQPSLVLANLRLAGVAPQDVVFILAGDSSRAVKGGFAAYEAVLTAAGARCVRLELPVAERKAPQHDKAGNLVIAALQAAAWNHARLLGATSCWSLESDILPPANALRTMRSALQFDGGWYDVVMATYPNTGFLGGHADPQHWIAPGAYDDERDIPAALAAQLAEPPKEQAAHEKLRREVEACPVRGNIFERQAKGWRPRGWFDDAYPGIGLGALVPTGWVGLGCTLMSQRALDLAQFTGYQGHGTQDLWLCWRVWHPAGLRLAVTSHAVCSHLKPEGLYYARHELGGPAHGHLRAELVTEV